MSKIKRKFAFFTIPEYKKEQEWLSAHHKNGWKLLKATLPGIYTFEQCEPEEVVYQLDYNQDGNAHKREYIQMFEDCNWEYITDMVGYSYFRKPAKFMDGEEGIFCDDASRMDMIERVFKGKMIPLLIIFFAIIIPQLFMQASLGNGVLFWLYIVLFIMYIVIFVQFARQYVELKRAMK